MLWGPINTFFSVFCKTYMAKISQISFSSLKKTTCIIIKFIKKLRINIIMVMSIV